MRLPCLFAAASLLIWAPAAVSAQVKADASAAVAGVPALGGAAAASALAPPSTSLLAPPAATAALPASPLPASAPAAAEGATPAPAFRETLRRLGIPEDVTGRLEAFLAARHPGDQDAVYHGLAHSLEVPSLTARVLEGETSLEPGQKVLLILSAALHDVDPARAPGTPARVAATLEHLDADPRARRLIDEFGSRFGFTRRQVKALIMATDFSPDPAERKVQQAAFEAEAAAAFPGEPWALEWGRRLAYFDQIATYVESHEKARVRVEGLAREMRAALQAAGRGPGPTDEQVLTGSRAFLDGLRRSPFFGLLPASERDRFEEVRASFSGPAPLAETGNAP